MKHERKRRQAGFSLMELMIAMVVVLMLLGIVSTVMSRSMSIRSRESRKTDALTAAQAALNIMSREISNAGFGIYTGADFSPTASNGLVVADSNETQLRFRANLTNVGAGSASTMTCPPACTNQSGEDVMYFFDNSTQSIVRFDRYGDPRTSVVVNRISQVRFRYFNYADDGTVTDTAAPTPNTGRVRLTVEVQLEPVQGQPNETVRFTSEINLRNSSYMLRQY